jgi:hypothetical protein
VILLSSHTRRCRDDLTMTDDISNEIKVAFMSIVEESESDPLLDASTWSVTDDISNEIKVAFMGIIEESDPLLDASTWSSGCRPSHPAS